MQAILQRVGQLWSIIYFDRNGVVKVTIEYSGFNFVFHVLF